MDASAIGVVIATILGGSAFAAVINWFKDRGRYDVEIESLSVESLSTVVQVLRSELDKCRDELG